MIKNFNYHLSHITQYMSEKRRGRPSSEPSGANKAPDAKREVVDCFDLGWRQIQGPHHKEQQDYCAITFPLEGGPVIALVADGVGQVERAAEASCLAGENFVREIHASVERDEGLDVAVLSRIISRVNSHLLEGAKDMTEELRAGGEEDEEEVWRRTDLDTTFTGIVVQGEKIVSVHLGDSRLYLLSQGLLTKMTTDETVAEESRARGKTDIEPEDEEILTNWLGNENAVPVIDEYKAVAGDTWLLVSDGVTKVLSDEELRNILSQQKDAQSLANDIIEAVKAKGVVDDTTAAVVRVK